MGSNRGAARAGAGGTSGAGREGSAAPCDAAAAGRGVLEMMGDAGVAEAWGAGAWAAGVRGCTPVLIWSLVRQYTAVTRMSKRERAVCVTRVSILPSRAMSRPYSGARSIITRNCAPRWSSDSTLNLYRADSTPARTMASRTTVYSSWRRSMRSFLRPVAGSGAAAGWGSSRGLPACAGAAPLAWVAAGAGRARATGGLDLRVNQLNNDMLAFAKKRSKNVGKCTARASAEA